ncbi:hypothetical protein BDY19DRAFT_990785 [Irpex rosettiformis]|uniref:Uncharacterized protein n=1 Tax=Irpex rosettiformis TaxID=378272 RepID=A0ACB8UCJ5_9APHY|nr:hypothetical protein BDY19DRAFT_990785 [Irpex rosettiformis]
MIQEHNIRDIKYLFAAHGPYASWDYIKKISASIPTQRKVKDHIEAEFNHFRRGKAHTTPTWESDVTNLQAAYHKGRVHVYQTFRPYKVSTSPPDFIAIGSSQEKLHGLISRWSANRVSVKSTLEEYHDDQEQELVVQEAESDGNGGNFGHEVLMSFEDELSAMLDNLAI